jgi:hypothetical protein
VEVQGKLKPFWEGIGTPALPARDRPQFNQPQLYLSPPLSNFLENTCRYRHLLYEQADIEILIMATLFGRYPEGSIELKMAYNPNPAPGWDSTADHSKQSLYQYIIAMI